MNHAMVTCVSECVCVCVYLYILTASVLLSSWIFPQWIKLVCLLRTLLQLQFLCSLSSCLTQIRKKRRTLNFSVNTGEKKKTKTLDSNENFKEKKKLENRKTKFLYLYVRMYASLSTVPCMYVCVHAFVHACMYACTYVLMLCLVA